MANSVAPQPMAPAALKPWWLADASTAPYVVTECVFHEFTKCPWLPTAMAISQMIMPTQTTTKATNMYRATTRTPSTITAVNIAVRIVAMIIISPLLGETMNDEWMPATYAAAGPMVPSMYVKLNAIQVRNTKVSEKFAKNPRNGFSVRDTQT